MYKLSNPDTELGPLLDKISHNHCDQRYTNYHYPRSKKEWWDNVNNFWPELFYIIQIYIEEDNLSLQEALDICNSGLRFESFIINLKEKEDERLLSFFSRAWACAPDNGQIHGIKCWDVLCDLCSESWVFYDSQSLTE